MRCNKAGYVMTRYIDEPLRLGRVKTNRLFKHLRVCESCRDEFNVYDELIRGFAPEAGCEELAAVPHNFEANVMRALADANEKRRVKPGDVVTALLCALSIAIGIITVTMLAINPESVSNMAAWAETSIAAASAFVGALFAQYRFWMAGAFGVFVFVFSRVATKRASKERERIDWN